MQGCVPGGDKPPRCRQQHPEPGLCCGHPNTPVAHRLRFMASEGSRAVPELPLTAPCSSSTPCRGCLASGEGAPAPRCSPRAAPWVLHGQKSLFCHRKKKLLCLSPDQLFHVPHEPVRGDTNQTSDNLAVPLFGLSWFSLQGISRSVLSARNPPAAPRPSFAPPQHKPPAAARSCRVLGSGSPVAPGTAQVATSPFRPAPRRASPAAGGGKKGAFARGNFSFAAASGPGHSPASTWPARPRTILNFCSLNCALPVK